MADAPFSALQVLGVDGTPTRLDSFWAQGPAVLVFLRHFG